MTLTPVMMLDADASSHGGMISNICITTHASSFISPDNDNYVVISYAYAMVHAVTPDIMPMIYTGHTPKLDKWLSPDSLILADAGNYTVMLI